MSALLDYRLEGRNGLDFPKEAVQKGYNIPVIFLTGQGDYEVDMEAMELGAADFLYKNKIDADMLDRSIRYALERRKAEENKLRLAAVVETSNDAIYVLTTDGAVASWNPGAERIYGYQAGGDRRAGRLHGLLSSRNANGLNSSGSLERSQSGEAVANFHTISPSPKTASPSLFP